MTCLVVCRHSKAWATIITPCAAAVKALTAVAQYWRLLCWLHRVFSANMSVLLMQVADALCAALIEGHVRSVLPPLLVADHLLARQDGWGKEQYLAVLQSTAATCQGGQAGVACSSTTFSQTDFSKLCALPALNIAMKACNLPLNACCSLARYINLATCWQCLSRMSAPAAAAVALPALLKAFNLLLTMASSTSLQVSLQQSMSMCLGPCKPHP